MAYSCIKDSDAYSLDYFSLDQFDTAHFAKTGKIRPLDGGQAGELGDYDFWVFNWHFITMASVLEPDHIARLKGPKFTVVLELAPDDPLKLVPPGVFDGFIALDPEAPATAEIFPFPRPLQGDPILSNPPTRDVPVIGSFGFATPGKGFELLVEAVNREFDRAVVRVNIPTGTYIDTDSIHRENYPKHIEKVCKRIAKPGVEVRFSYDFLSAQEVVEWCADNDLNCFMYTRCQPGLSATTDQGIMSGRPLLTLSNDTFRHVQAYIPAYPVTGLRQAIDTTTPVVRQIQKDWSRQSFNDTFHRMLASFEIVPSDEKYGRVTPVSEDGPPLVLVLTKHDPDGQSILDYRTRIADSLGRSKKYDVVLVPCESPAAIKLCVDEVRPSAVIVLDFPLADHKAVSAALAKVEGPKIFLANDLPASAAPSTRGELRILPRRPIIPFYTVYVALAQKAAIHLIGFGAEGSNFEQVIEKIANESPGSEVFVEFASDGPQSYWQRVIDMRAKFSNLNIHTYSFPADSATIITMIASDKLAIFYADPRRLTQLEDIASLAMTTERSVVFTRAAPFPGFLGRETYVEDSTIPDHVDAGMASQIRLVHDFGEWQFSAEIDRLLTNKVKGRSKDLPSLAAVAALRPNAKVPATAQAILALRGEAFLNAAYRAVLGRAPDPAGMQHHLRELRAGTSRSYLLASLRLSAEGRMRSVDFPGLAAVLHRHAQYSRPVIGRLLRLQDRLGRLAGGGSATPVASITAKTLLDRRGGAFLNAAYEAVLGRAPDPQGYNSHLEQLLNGVSRRTILATMRLSAEGRAYNAQFPGLAQLVREQRLLRLPIVGRVLRRAGWGADRMDVSRALRVLENQVHRLWEAQNTAPVPVQVVEAPAAAPLVAAAERVGDGAAFLLLDSTDLGVAPASPYVVSLVHAWRSRDQSLRIVLWDAAGGRLRLANRPELDQLGLAREVGPELASYPEADAPPVILTSASHDADDWLLVPDVLSVSTGQSDLVELNVIMEARRLGLRTAFVFHGAEPLRSTKYAGPAAEAHERYMQTLLLADLIIPESGLAESDLNDFFVQHQRASFVPPIRKARAPVEGAGDKDPWGDYVRRLRGLMTDAADASRQLTSVYYWLDPNAAPDRKTFSDQLARSLTDRGVGVIPVSWNAADQTLAQAGTPAGGSDLWAAWTAPGQADAPRWLLAPEGVSAEDFEPVSTFAKTAGLRLAAILHEPEGDKPAVQEPEFISLAAIDKVFAVSPSRFDDFYGFLLGWRGKVHSAEQRFKVLGAPDEIVGVPRRASPKAARQGVVKVAFWMPVDDQVDPAVLLEAAAQAAAKASDRLEFTFVDPTGAHAALKAKIATIPQARWEESPNEAQIRELLNTADFTVFPGADLGHVQPITESLWRGLPCLTAAGAGSDKPSRPGTVVADLQSADAAAEAILKLSMSDWRRHLAQEAIARPVRTWDDYAKALTIELATDRKTDGLNAPDTEVRRDVYESLVNLRRRPKLSLCISTYKRAGWLSVNLRNIFAQIPEARDDLEVLVVDNTSPDDTPEVVKPYLSRSDFRYLRNPRNVGMLGNLAVTAQRARGEYIWILGDDDLTRPGAIERALEILQERPATELIYFNYGYTSEADPATVTDLDKFLTDFNVLEPSGPDIVGSASLIAAKNENFYTAIYSHLYRRDHALRSYCQDTSGRIFSTMVSCIPTAYYVLNYMPDAPAYWVGDPALVVNSNVSWADYGAMLDLEHLPRAWDAAERAGTPAEEVDKRRANRLWLVEMMWKELLENDKVGNSAYVETARVLMRLKHLDQIEKYIDKFRATYERAHATGHPSATVSPSKLFSAFEVS